MHEIIALHERILARRARLSTQPFTLARIERARFAPVDKGPGKALELRPSRPVARREARLRPVAERMSLSDKLAHRVRGAGKLRLFRLWKVFGKSAEAARPEITRPLAERLAWLRGTRRL